MKKIYSMLGFDPAEYSLKTEVVAGITTFLTIHISLPSIR